MSTALLRSPEFLHLREFYNTYHNNLTYLAPVHLYAGSLKLRVWEMRAISMVLVLSLTFISLS